MSKHDESYTLEEHQQFIDDASQIEANQQAYYFRHWYMKFFAPEKGARILDLGGYLGATAHHYAGQGHMVTTVEGAKVYCDKIGPRRGVEVVCSLFEDYEAEEEFDACCCTEALNFVIDPLEVLRVAHRALKQGGLIFVTVPAVRMAVHRQYISGSQLKDLMKQAGFDAGVMKFDDKEHVPQFTARGWKV